MYTFTRGVGDGLGSARACECHLKLSSHTMITLFGASCVDCGSGVQADFPAPERVVQDELPVRDPSGLGSA